MRRSLKKLAESEYIIYVGRKGWSDGRKRYGLPKQAEWYFELCDRGYKFNPQCTPDVKVEGTDITVSCLS